MQTPVFVNHSFINTDANEYATGTQCNHKCKEKMKASQRLQPITFKEIRKKLMRDKIRIFAPSYHSSSPSTSLIWETFFLLNRNTIEHNSWIKFLNFKNVCRMSICLVIRCFSRYDMTSKHCTVRLSQTVFRRNLCKKKFDSYSEAKPQKPSQRIKMQTCSKICAYMMTRTLDE